MKHIFGFSGGIDSQAAALWGRNNLPTEDIILLNSDAGGNEDPFTEEFIDWYSANVFPVVKVQAIVSDLWAHDGLRVHVSERAAAEKGYSPTDLLRFDDLAVLKGRFPSSQLSFCTEILKLRPQSRWMRANLVGEDFERYTGVRRDESERRKTTPDREWDTFFDCWLNHPIASWTKRQCFGYVKTAGERYNELYELGFSRVGCAPCHQANKEDILLWAMRRPANIDKVRAWEERTGRTFFPPIVPGMALNFIDDVVRWAKTARGGRQNLLPIMHERPACESKYGLCE